MQRAKGCEEYEFLSRRGLIERMSYQVLRNIAPSWMPTVTYKSDYRSKHGPEDRDVLISIYLRGGCDGLTVCVPYADAAYYSHRSSLAVPRPDQTTNANRGIDLNGFFALPPAMGALKELYDAGHFLIVHAAGLTNGTRSHFDAQQFMEAGKADKALWTGWLGRHLASIGEMRAGSLLRGVGLSGTLALTLEGGPKSTTVPSLTDFSFGGRSESEAMRTEWLRTAYREAESALADAGENTIKTVELLKSLNYNSYQPGGGAQYNQPMPNGGGTYGAANDFGNAMRAAAAIIRGDVGVEAIHIDFGNWDTHEYQAPFEYYGPMYMGMYSLATNLRALYTDLQASNRMANVTVAIISEFGRTVQQNGNYGTDHGHGNVVMLLGQNVNGGQVLGTWPGLAQEQLFEGNALQITTDYRDIIAEVVQKRLKNPDLTTVFPDPTYTPSFRNAVRAS
jgi:uncharacterized protein (DUF1501 family)